MPSSTASRSAWERAPRTGCDGGRCTAGGIGSVDAVETVGEYLDHVERNHIRRNASNTGQNEVLASALLAWHTTSFLWRDGPPR
jgi:hypothetical protein